MKDKLLLLVLICSIWPLSNAYPQYFITGQDRASTKWKQIKTEHFKVIFPDNFEDKARMVAAYLENSYPYTCNSLDVKPRRISVVLHNQTVISNAFAAWAPKRTEFYTCPPQDQYSHDWLKQLSLHEYRHTAQYSKMNHGLTKSLTFILGEQATAGVLGTFVPFWFIEGDAVLTETVHSNSGRGRLPSFEMPIRAQVMEKGAYSYDKAALGSYRDFVPDRYILGYQLVSMGRYQYGTEIWEKALERVAKYPFTIIPFSHSLKKTTGYNKVSLYEYFLKTLDSLWNIQKTEDYYTKFKVISPEKDGEYIDYTLPAVINNRSVVSKKTSLDDITRIVLIDSAGKEKKIFTPGYMFEKSFSASGDLLAWSELAYDLRWENTTYAVIKTYDLKRKRVHQLTRKSRIFAPAVSHDATKIAAVEVLENNESAILILDSRSGERLVSIPSGRNMLFMTPSWSADDRMITAIVLGEKGKSIALINPDNKTVTYILEISTNEISKPVYFKNYIIYTGNYTGIENLFAYDTVTREILRITSALYGAADPCIAPDNENIYYCNYTADGNEIVSIAAIPRFWDPLEGMQNHSLRLADSIVKQENGIADLQEIPRQDYTVKKYRKGLHLVNIHSWAPAAINTNTYDILPGASVFSQNILGTTITALGYEYDLNEETGTYYADFNFLGWYPALDLRAEYTKKAGKFRDPHENIISYEYFETRLKYGMFLPLNLSSGKYYRKLQPRIQMTYIFYSMAEKYPFYFVNSVIRTIDYQIFGYNLLRVSKRDLYPKWGQVIQMDYRHNPLEGDTLGNIKSAYARLYFPGIFKHHGISIYAGIQDKTNKDYIFPDNINYPRGFHNEYNEDLRSVATTYKFPVYYPDLSLGSLLYLKRISTALFYDQAVGYIHGCQQKYKSTGMEFYFDVHILRFLAPITLGIRGIYFPDISDTAFEFLYSVNFDEI